MTLEQHAMREFKAAGWIDENGEWGDDMQKCICLNVLAMLKAFSDGNHSGSTAPYALGIFNKLASFEPLIPLTGKDSEWNDVGDDMWQNNRCSHVFKDKDGKAYDMEGKIFREPDGCCYTNSESRVYVKFPYTPKSTYVDVEVEVKAEKEDKV